MIVANRLDAVQGLTRADADVELRSMVLLNSTVLLKLRVLFGSKVYTYSIKISIGRP